MKFPIEPGERKITLLCAGLLFAVTSAFIIMKSARDAIFLSDYPATALPYFMTITTALTALLATTYIRLYKTLSLTAAVELSLRIFAFGTLVLYATILGEWSFASPVLYVWTGIFGTIAPVQCWSVISQQLLTRQAKRYFGIIGSGGILGAAAGGLFASWIASVSSVATLLPTAAMLMLVSFFIVQALAALGWRASYPAGTEVQQVRLNPRFILLVIVVVGIGTVVATFADFQFKVIAQREMFTAEKLAAFFGSFYAITGLGTFLFQLLATPLLMRHLGVAAAMAFLPLGLSIGNGFVLATGSLTAAITLKGLEQLLKHSVDRSSLEVLYMAIPEDVKIRLKSLIDTVGVQTAEALGSALLILLFSIGRVPLTVIGWISLCLLGISLACTVLLGKEYPRALKKAFEQKDVNFSSVKTNFFTTDFYQVLPELLQKSNKQTVLDLLQLLSATGNKKLKSYLEPLLEHPDSDVRLKSLQLLFGQELDLSNKVEGLVTDPDPRIRVEAIRYLCFRSTIDPLAKLAHLLTDPDPTVQAAACACSLNLETTPEQEDAYRQLERLMGDSMTTSRLEVRLEVAGILKHVRPSPSSDQLFRKLLKDPDVNVRKATLRSIAETHPPGLIQDTFQLMDRSDVRQDVRRALGSYGSVIYPELMKILEDPLAHMEGKKLALKILSDASTNPPVQLLIPYAIGSNLTLRFIAIKALNKIRRRRTAEIPQQAVESLLNQEIVALEVEFERVRFYSPKSGGLMESVLTQRQRWARERIFRALALHYDPKSIYSSYRALTGVDPRIMDAALEYLDTILLPEHRNRILSLLERTSQSAIRNPEPSVRKSVLFGFLGARDQLPAAAILADLNDQEFALWKQEISDALNVFTDLPLVRETLDWRNSELENTNVIRKLTTIQKLEHLGRADIFTEVGPNELLLLANQCAEEEFSRDSIIFQEGDPAHDLFLLIEGQVELSRDSKVIEVLTPGKTFGTISTLGDQHRLLTATAKGTCSCLRLNRDSFWDVLEDYPILCRGIFKVIAQQMQYLMSRVPAPISS